ncbi:MAG TPA: hypothetical protein VHL30_00255 [Chlamydiales bacterium]|jgi:hypothetical protein|nr:hypothetical protein [Chlamydiales bacterium]
MEIEFKVKILPTEMRQTFYACASFAGAAALSTLLLASYLKELWPVVAIAGTPFCWLSFSEYRKMLCQSRNPDALRLEEKALLYLKNEKKTLRIPYSAIGKIQYKEGLQVSLKRGMRVELLDPSFQLRSLKRKNCDLFFEWFGSSVKTGLDDVMHSNQPHHLRSF